MNAHFYEHEEPLQQAVMVSVSAEMRKLHLSAFFRAILFPLPHISWGGLLLAYALPHF
jgi:hypothetical protein